MEYHFEGIWRMDWGLGNPNKTAALIGLLMVAVWVLPLVKRWLFWVALPVFTALGVCLMHTLSRGGVVAVTVGLGVVLWRLPRPWPRSRVRGMALALTVMLAGAVMLQATTRLAQSWKDPSITNRLDIWREVPRMMADAPGGWGLGKSGNTYCSWYQALDRYEAYRTLVNSHFTWLVEFGWPVRFLYIFGWFAVLLLCFPRRGESGFAIAFGTWIVFLIAASFSSVAESPWIWIVPVLALLCVLAARFRRHLWPTRLAWGSGLLGSIAILGLFYLAGMAGMAGNLGRAGIKIHRASNGSIYVGNSRPNLWMLVDPATAGHTYPRALREYCRTAKNTPSIGIAASVAGLPDMTGRNLVILGARPAAEWQALRKPMTQCKSLLLVAPNVVPAELNLPPAVLAKSTVVFGEFTRLFSSSSWTGAGGRFERIEGVGDFFQDWPQLVFTSLAQPNQAMPDQNTHR